MIPDLLFLRAEFEMEMAPREKENRGRQLEHVFLPLVCLVYLHLVRGSLRILELKETLEIN